MKTPIGSLARGADAASLGLEMGISVILCTLAALWLQNHVTHWSPGTVLIGAGVGCVAAGRALVRTIRTYREQLSREAAILPDTKHEDTP